MDDDPADAAARAADGRARRPGKRTSPATRPRCSRRPNSAGSSRCSSPRPERPGLPRVLVPGTGAAWLAGHRHGAAAWGPWSARATCGPRRATEAESVGATFIESPPSSVGPASGEGGYARALTEAERTAQQQELARPHRAARRRDHHGPGAWPPPAAAGHRGCAQVDDSRIGHRYKGASTLGGNVAWLRFPARRSSLRAGSRSSARRGCRPAWPPPHLPCTRETSARCCCTW